MFINHFPQNSPRECEYIYYSIHINFGNTWKTHLQWYDSILPPSSPDCQGSCQISSLSISISVWETEKSLLEPDQRNGGWGVSSTATPFLVRKVLMLSLCEQVHCHVKAGKGNVPNLVSHAWFSVIKISVPLGNTRYWQPCLLAQIHYSPGIKECDQHCFDVWFLVNWVITILHHLFLSGSYWKQHDSSPVMMAFIKSGLPSAVFTKP